MSGRSSARRHVLQMLFLVDQNKEADPRRIQRYLEDELKNVDLVEFAWALFRGVRENQAELDELIRKTASNWRLERMAVTDRNVIRLGAYEMRHYGTAPAIVLNEAIEIAREFGTENSASFVNGVLDKLVPDAARSDAKTAQ
ncbi:MAG: transcription antitermination factor NusB [Planctomycetaceae bacterium]